MNFLGSCEAPPIRNPSIFFIDFNSFIFFGFTEPPYKTLIFLTFFLIKLIKNIDGFLIGGASQDPKKFIDIIKKTYN